MARRRPPLSPEAAAVVRALADSASGRPLPARRPRRRRSPRAGRPPRSVRHERDRPRPAVAAPRASGSAGPSPAQDRSDTDKVVNWANWTLYLDYDDKTKKYPTLEAFQKKTGIKATYAEDVDDNDTYYGKIQAQLKAGQDIGKDIIVLTDWMAGRLVRQGYVQKFDDAAIPNKKNILPALADVASTRAASTTLTWQSGYAGLGYNKQQVKTPIRTVDDLWRPELKGRVEVLSEWRDTMGLIMMSQGVSIDKPFTQAQFDKALDVLQDPARQRPDPPGEGQLLQGGPDQW